MPKICPVCGVEFGHDKTPKYLAKRTYCSNACVGIALRGKRTNRVILTCAHCGKEYGGDTARSQINDTYCSIQCSNKARVLEQVPCPVCGKLFKPSVIDTGNRRRLHCSVDCASIARRGKLSNSSLKHPAEIRELIQRMYPTCPLQEIQKATGLTVSAIRDIAYKMRLKRPPMDYSGFSQRMIDNNPMKHPETKAKVAAWRAQHPDIVQAGYAKLVIGKQQSQKDKPSKLEYRLCSYLDDLGVSYEHVAKIKDKFLVDIRIGNIIIQADGDYWHGHPRFEPLTERQLKQQKRDAAQDKYLTTCGYIVIRIWECEMSRSRVVSELRKYGIIA